VRRGEHRQVYHAFSVKDEKDRASPSISKKGGPKGKIRLSRRSRILEDQAMRKRMEIEGDSCGYPLNEPSSPFETKVTNKLAGRSEGSKGRLYGWQVLISK